MCVCCKLIEYKSSIFLSYISLSPQYGDTQPKKPKTTEFTVAPADGDEVSHVYLHHLEYVNEDGSLEYGIHLEYVKDEGRPLHNVLGYIRNEPV